jgi:hypothetical protein
VAGVFGFHGYVEVPVIIYHQPVLKPSATPTGDGKDSDFCRRYLDAAQWSRAHQPPPVEPWAAELVKLFTAMRLSARVRPASGCRACGGPGPGGPRPSSGSSAHAPAAIAADADVEVEVEVEVMISVFHLAANRRRTGPDRQRDGVAAVT